ncbi:hypothetical protein CKF46_06810 [Klebsiella pneumoniae]|nr:hypothetical protein CKF46_06810 [Klebsiella pneumoniae]
MRASYRQIAPAVLVKNGIQRRQRNYCARKSALPFVAARWLVVLARKSAGYPPLPSSCGKVAR